MAVDRESWRALLGPALRIVDSLEGNGYGTLDFRLGGGTVLMFRFDHRISKDIDIFLYDAQALNYLSPRLNDLAAREALDYEEQANVVKLSVPGGSIDFIVAAPVMPDAAPEVQTIEGRLIALDATCEILAKKLMYRADGFKARDVFDMATALSLDRDAALRALQATGRTRAALRQRLTVMAGLSEVDLLAGILPTETGRGYAEGMVARLAAAVAEVDA